MNGTCVGLLHPNSAYVQRVFSVAESVMNSLMEWKTLPDTTRLIYAAPLIEFIAFCTCRLMWLLMTVWVKKKKKVHCFCWHVILWFPHPWLRLETLHSHEPNWKHLSYFSFFKTLILFSQMSSTFQLTVKKNAYCTGITGSWLAPIAAKECKLPALHRNCYIQLYFFFNGFYVISTVHFAILSAHDCLLILCTHRDALAK